MSNVSEFLAPFRYGHKLYPQNMVLPTMPLEGGRVWFVDGDKSGDGGGASWEDGFKYIQSAINAASAGDVIYVAARTIPVVDGSAGGVGTDPINYDEHLSIANGKSSLSIIGVARGNQLGGLPQVKPSTVLTGNVLDIHAPGCLIANLGFNGSALTADAGSSGIALNDDGGITDTAFGTTIVGCHFKSLGRGHALAAAAIAMPDGAAWNLRILGNTFFNCLAGISFLTTSTDRGQDIIIQGNNFSSTVYTNVDCDINLAGLGGGCEAVVIDRNVFATVDVPGHSSGDKGLYLDLTGCEGILSNNVFACVTGEDDTPKTFKAAGTAAYVPATVRMVNNQGEAAVGSSDKNESGAVERAS